ncbi:CAP domain-containing protein [Salimicrobium flavidum]|uniref:Uncharacterized protein, YkwD family n=1 Tax=Salimicrobium flavidum TaxID=570947 RepID=A0A1N7ITD0_9BACI|nr:CAP domain-containing protein [Salimicrobium flavidum]SIS40358.1 uncharacterized protein, YkwD family [Salimicrobium flavidum]
MQKYWASALFLLLLGVLNPAQAESEVWPEKQVPVDKPWTIEFSTSMDEEMLESNSYIGIRKEDGTFHPVERFISEATLRIEPKTFYESGEMYELVISPQLQSETSQVISTGVVQTFTAADGISEFEQRVVELTNVEREKYGLAPLELNEELSRVAEEKSRDMEENRYFAHQSPTYGSPFTMMNDFGFDYRFAGENIAAGQVTPEEVVNAWMNSEGHRENILTAAYEEIGIGYVDSDGAYVTYWTQMFYTAK